MATICNCQWLCGQPSQLHQYVPAETFSTTRVASGGWATAADSARHLGGQEPWGWGALSWRICPKGCPFSKVAHGLMGIKPSPVMVMAGFATLSSLSRRRRGALPRSIGILKGQPDSVASPNCGCHAWARDGAPFHPSAQNHTRTFSGVTRRRVCSHAWESYLSKSSCLATLHSPLKLKLRILHTW